MVQVADPAGHGPGAEASQDRTGHAGTEAAVGSTPSGPVELSRQ